MPIGWWSPSLWDCAHITYLFIYLFHTNWTTKTFAAAARGQFVSTETGRSAAVNQKKRKKKRTREKRWQMKWSAERLWAVVWWSARGAGSSRTCEANEMSRRSIWSEAGPRTQRPNRNYVPHRGDVQEDCLAPFVVNKSAGGVGGGGRGGREGQVRGARCSHPALGMQHHGRWWMKHAGVLIGNDFQSGLGYRTYCQQLIDYLWDVSFLKDPRTLLLSAPCDSSPHLFRHQLASVTFTGECWPWGLRNLPRSFLMWGIDGKKGWWRSRLPF